MKKPFGKTKVGKLLKSKVGKSITGLIRETLQSTPFVGTVITAFKEDTKENPKGLIKLSKWHMYRLVIGLITGYLMYRGVDSEIIDFALNIVGI